MNTSKFRLLRKSCSVHITEFEIVVHHNIDNWIQRTIGMIYLSADNSPIDCRLILANHSYT